MRTIKLTDIDCSATWTGYYWLSDSDRPVVVDGEPIDAERLLGKMPFVVEGQLCNASRTLSLSLRYADGECRVTEFDAHDIDNGDNTTESFISLRMGPRTLQFKRRWVAEADPMCLGMDVLLPAGLIFVGFGNINDKQAD